MKEGKTKNTQSKPVPSITRDQVLPPAAALPVNKSELPALVSIPAKTAIELRDFFGKQSSGNRFSVEAYEVLRDALNNHGYHEK